MAYPQLTGLIGTSDKSTTTRPILVAIVILAAVLGLAAWRWLPRGADALTVAPQQRSAPVGLSAPIAVPDGPTEDQRLHLEHAEQALLTAAEQLTAARRQLAALSPDLSRSYLQYEKRRADSAWTSCDAAARAIEQAQDDVKVVTAKGKD